MTRLGYALGYAVQRAIEANATDAAIDFSGRFARLVSLAMRMRSSQRVTGGVGVAGAPAAVAIVWFFIVASMSNGHGRWFSGGVAATMTGATPQVRGAMTGGHGG